MHKWKLFKKSAALVLSSAVIASGVPVTAMASEAEVFSDVSEETQGDTAQEEGESEDRESVSQDQPEVGEADIQSRAMTLSLRQQRVKIRFLLMRTAQRGPLPDIRSKV